MIPFLKFYLNYLIKNFFPKLIYFLFSKSKYTSIQLMFKIWVNYNLLHMVFWLHHNLVYKFSITIFDSCWGQNFHATWLYFFGNPHHFNILWILGKSILKPKRAHIYTKWSQSPRSKTHGNIISSISWFKLMAQHLIFNSWSKLMSLIGRILGVVVWGAKKYVQ